MTRVIPLRREMTHGSFRYGVTLLHYTGRSSVCYRRWIAAGIIFLGDLLNEGGILYSYREFNNIYDIRTNFLEFNGISAAIRNFLRNNDIRNVPIKQFGPVIPRTLALICKDKKGCRGIYRQIVNAGEPPKSLQKWKNDLGIHPDSQILVKESIYDQVFQFTKDPKLLWFQFRINHRILGTNYLLKKMNIVAVDSCTFCNNAPETLIHFFWECEITKQFLNQLCIFIENKCNIQLNNWNIKEVLFGSCKLDKVQNMLLLQAKYFLFFNKVKCSVPSFECFKKRINSFYKIERYNAIKCFQQTQFEKLWEKYKPLVQ